MKFKKIILPFVVAILLTLTAQAQESVKLRFQPKIGSSLYTEMKMDMNMDMQIKEQSINTKMLMAFGIDMKTKSRATDVNEVDFIFDKITMNISNPMMNGNYNSEIENQADPFSQKMQESFKDLLKKPINMKISTLGALTEPVDFQKLFPTLPTDKSAELKEQMNNQFIQFPEKAVKVGDSWLASSPMAQIGVMELTYTVKSITKDVVNLTVVGIAKPNAKKSELQLKETAISGSATVDKKTGETLDSKLVMKLKMSVNAKGQSMDMEMNAFLNILATRK